MEYVWVREHDRARLGERADALTHRVGSQVFMRMRDGHCGALDVRRDAAGGVEFLCTIYENRPEICRDLGRGSPECLGDRETKAAAVVAAVSRQ